MSRHCSSAMVICCSVWHWPVTLHSLVYSLEHEILARLCHVPPAQIMIDKWTWQHQDSSCLVFDWDPCLQPATFFYLAAFHESITLLSPFAFCHSMSVFAISQRDLFLSLALSRLPCSDVARANHCDWSNDTSPWIGVTLNALYFPTEKNTPDSKPSRRTQNVKTRKKRSI